jgi:carbohydrate diacid regulator
MSNSVFQSVIVQLKEISDRTFGVIDTEGCVVSCTDVSLLGEHWADAALKVGSSSDSVVTFGQKCFKAIVGNSNYYEYAVFCTGDDEASKSFCQLAYIALNDAKIFYEEKHDRGTFVKNIIMDNILPGDIYIRAKELHFATDAPRAVFLIRQVGHGDVATVDVLSGMFSDKIQDFVLSINEMDIAVVKQISPNVTSEELEKIALAMGMVPSSQVPHISMDVTVPQQEAEPTAWENFCAFLTGLFA